MLRVQTGLVGVDYLCLAADGSRLAVSQADGDREVWAFPFASTDRILQLPEPRWPGTGPIRWPGAMSKLVFDPTGGLLDAGVLASAVPFLVDPREPPTPDDQDQGQASLEEAYLQDFEL